MPRTIEQAKEIHLPVIPVRGTVAFPGVQISLELMRDFSISAFAAANKFEGKIFLLTQKDPEIDIPTEKDFYHVGTVCQIKRVNRTENGNLNAVFEGFCRAKVSELKQDENGFHATVICKSIHTEEEADIVTQEKINSVIETVERIKNIHPLLTDEILRAAKGIKTPGLFCDFIASASLLNFKNKQRLLEIFHPILRLERLSSLVEEETELLLTEYSIHSQVKERIDEHQREYFLREQMKVIQEELGDDDNEFAEYRKKIEALCAPQEVKAKLEKELSRLEKVPFGSAEGSVIRSYLDVCLEVPWGKTTQAKTTVRAAEKILEADHYGLEKIKERILEIVAVKQLCPDVKNQILCLVGPPGVGKTSIAASVARAMKRKYARISLGGIRDEADIRGHRKTYVGAMPGRIVEAITAAGVTNPVIVLDEIDKLSTSLQGDPASALLEVLDPEQNRFFRDHFLELPLDLSDCIFIATANNEEGIPAPLIDRMELIELSAYTATEKRAIAKNHWRPKQLKRYGLKATSLRFTDAAIDELIAYYTREAGVRNLEREISSLCRKAAKKMIDEKVKRVTISPEAIHEMLGKRRYIEEKLEKTNPVGIVNGLAYTRVGGDLLKVEVNVMEGSGKLELTGRLGEVMQESARIALSYIRTKTKELGIEPDFYKTKDIHIHFPEGAVPKDGPSAGVAMTCALASALSGAPTRRDVAMTGEITLRGKVLAIGGLKEKTMAAYTAGIHTVLIPRENEKDLDEIDREAREHLKFVLCDTVEDAFCAVLLDGEKENEFFPVSPLLSTAARQTNCAPL